MTKPLTAWRRLIVTMLLSALALAACSSAAAKPDGHDSPGASNGTHGTSKSSTSSSSTTTTSPMQAPLPQPSAAQPLTILEIGDSLGVDLGWGLGYTFASDPYVRVVQKGVGDTGLARPDYYNWPATLEAEVQEYHPGAVVVFIGGNDGQGFMYNGQAVEYGTPLWHQVYAARVGEVMTECLAAHARVLWVGMPVMQDPTLSATMANLDSIYQAAAAKHPGVTYFSSWPVFSDSAGQYTSSVVVNGQTEVLRDPDGTHLTYDGENLLAANLVAPMEKAWGIKLFPTSASSSTTSTSVGA